MATPDPFPQFIPNRAAAALRRLEEAIWSERVRVPVAATVTLAEPVTLAAARRLPLEAVTPGSAWGRLYDQRWCRLDLGASGQGETLAARGQPRYLEWRDQGEATLHLDGVPHYGFDVAHRYAPLPEDATDVWVESICCQSAIWHPLATGLSPEGSVFEGAFLVRRNDAAWTAYHDLKCLFDVMMWWRSRQLPAPPAELARYGLQPTLERTAPVHRKLLHALTEAVDAFDTAGLPALRRRLARAYRELRDPRPHTTAIMTGHAHIDLVWLWPERIGEAKAVHTFATVNRLMDVYPEFKFAYSQPASYRAVGARSPELLDAVRKRIRRGRWEATGAMEVESDTQLPCGEALARSFLLGQAEFAGLRGGQPARLLWLPDVFGYSGCLPQLMRLTGVSWFFTTKLTWSALTRFPYSSFRWRGSDGSEVIAHVTPEVGYNNRVELSEIQAQAEAHTQVAVHPEFLHPTGYGDGGGGPTEEMCERVRRLDALAGTPGLRWGQPEAFFAALALRAEALPVHQGECYLEYHRGTYTTHGNLKAAYRALERALQVREAVAAAQGEAPDLTATWRRLIFAQFHDYLPGSAVADVYLEGVPELERLAREEQAAAQAALEAGGAGETWSAFNPLPLPWQGWLQTAGGGRVWMALAPLAGGGLPETTHATAPAAVQVRGRVLDNGQVRAEIDARGELQRLVVAGREVAFERGAAVPVLYPDVPANYEAWDVDRHSLDLGRPVSARAEITTESSVGEASVVVRRPLGERSALTLRYRLVAGESVLRIDVDLDWHEQQTLLKLHFPTRYRGTMARFGAPFGSALRGQLPGTTAVEAQWEVAGSRWATVAHDGERDGLMLITEAKYGFSARSGDLSVSLTRSARITGCDDHRYAAPRGLGRLVPASPYSDQGAQRIRLAVGHYDLGAPRANQPAALADLLFTAAMVHRGAPAASAGFAGLEGGETLIPAWAMPLGGGAWVLRLHEAGGQAGVARLRLHPGWRAVACGLDGRIEGARQGDDGCEVRFGPYQIISLRLSR